MADIYADIASRSPLPERNYRVVVSGAAGISQHDFDSLESAKTYADDVAAEYADESQLAYVYDGDFVRIYEGRPYYGK